MNDGMQPYVEGIYIAPKAGAPMQKVNQVEALKGLGLRGDRYSEGIGYYTGPEACQVTLIRGEDLDEIAESGLSVLEGQHRRNIVTRGLDLKILIEEHFSIGDAEFVYGGPRTPCYHLESITEKGMLKELTLRSGIYAAVIKGGTIREGDIITVKPRK